MTNDQRNEIIVMLFACALIAAFAVFLTYFFIAPMCERTGDSLWRAWKKESQNDYLLKCAEKFGDAVKCAEIFTDKDYYGNR